MTVVTTTAASARLGTAIGTTDEVGRGGEEGTCPAGEGRGGTKGKVG